MKGYQVERATGKACWDREFRANYKSLAGIKEGPTSPKTAVFVCREKKKKKKKKKKKRNFYLVRGCWFGGRVWVLTSSNQLLDKGKC